jgi:hypothetical protein
MVLTDCSGYSYCAPFVVAFTLIRKRESDVLIVFILLLKSQIVVFLLIKALLLARSVCANCALTTLAFCPMEPLSRRALAVRRPGNVTRSTDSIS